MTEDASKLQQNQMSSGLSAASDGRNSVDLIDLLIVVAKHKRLVLGFSTMAALIALVVTLLMPDVYTSTARILPPQQNQSHTAAILGQLSGLGGVAGASLGIKNPTDLYVGILKSRFFANLNTHKI